MNSFSNLQRVLWKTLVNTRNCYSSSSSVTEKSLNQIMLLGRVGNDPQMRGSDDRPVTIFTLATNTIYKDNAGSNQQKTEWHRISVFKPFLRDTAYNYIKKGQRCLVQGRLAYGQIVDANGVHHTTATIIAEEIVFLSRVHAEEASTASDLASER